MNMCELNGQRDMEHWKPPERSQLKKKHNEYLMRVYVVETGAPIAHQSIAIKITSNACHCSRSGHAASAGMIVSEPSVFDVTSSEADTMTRQVIEREGDCSIKSDSSQCEIDHIA